MKKQLLFAFVLLVSFTGFSNSKYTINDSNVEQLMAESVPMQLEISADHLKSTFSTDAVLQEKNVWIAVALDFFLGGLAVHRVYLGANPGLIAGYFFTCGGIFGILPLVDLILLVINNEDISPYVNNSNFFMWKQK